MGKLEIGIYFCVTVDILTKVLLKGFWSSPLPTIWHEFRPNHWLWLVTCNSYSILAEYYLHSTHIQVSVVAHGPLVKGFGMSRPGIEPVTWKNKASTFHGLIGHWITNVWCIMIRIMSYWVRGVDNTCYYVIITMPIPKDINRKL